MAFIIDKQELKPGLVLFRRGDVAHRYWYCRIKLPKVDRYKTYTLKTADINTAREKAYDLDAEVRAMIKHDVAVFQRPFRQVAADYVQLQETRAERGEITRVRAKNIKSWVEGPLDRYVGATQIHLISHDRWNGYPAWRREEGTGHFRSGRMSDASIATEMAVFSAVMSYAVTKKYVPASHRFPKLPNLDTPRREEFTNEEWSRLHSVARAWVKDSELGKAAPGRKARKRPDSDWYRFVTYQFILIMGNTGMRPVEAKNLRWRDVSLAKDRDKRDIVVMFVQGKGKTRRMVAPISVNEYLDRIRKITRSQRWIDGKAQVVVGEPTPDDYVFAAYDGTRADKLYEPYVQDLLEKAKLRDTGNGVPRSTYCFRHTYATFRLHEGIDVYFLAEQMGTSVKMIEDHYGHANTIRHADRVLQGMHGWQAEAANEDDFAAQMAEETAKASKAAAARLTEKARSSKR